MSPHAYYNEHDPRAAAWLRELIREGHIAPGDVDERSIGDVRPGDLEPYTQCHFFAGIGVWSYALRRAGWPDDRAVWTGSCPCQPFSAAGKGGGLADERHLWPAWFHLITQRRPQRIYGEQVASKGGLAWLDLVLADLEGAGYAPGAIDICAAGVGAPHIRQRLFFVADAEGTGGREQLGFVLGSAGPSGGTLARQGYGDAAGADCTTLVLADSSSTRLEGRDAREVGRQRAAFERGGGAGGLADDDIARQRGQSLVGLRRPAVHDADGRGELDGQRPGPTNGLWGAADWIACRDGKWRPVEPGTFPLAHGAAARVGRLRGYGNAINAEVAIEFIRATL